MSGESTPATDILQTQIEGLAASIDTANGRITTNEQNIADNTTNIGELTETLNTSPIQGTSLQDWTTATQDDLTDLKNTVNGISTDIGERPEGITKSLWEEIADAKATSASQASSISSLANEVSSAKASLQGINSMVSTLSSNVSSLTGTVGNNTTAIEGLGDDVATNTNNIATILDALATSPVEGMDHEQWMADVTNKLDAFQTASSDNLVINW
jgi:chromosome segregation ATPase